MLLVVGRIVRAHGIHGELVVDVRTDEPEARFAVGSVLTTATEVRGELRTDPAAPDHLTVEATRPHQGRLLVTFDGFYERTMAESLRGLLLCVDSAEVPEPDNEDEFNDYQLIGLRVQSPEGRTLGEVVRIDHAPASDLLVLRLPEGRTALVPFVKAFVPEVDVAEGRLVLTPPGGLLDL